MKRMYIGLATTPHDPAIAIVDEIGDILFAEGAERYLQNKRGWGAAPDDLIRIETLLHDYCNKADALVVCSSWSTGFTKRARFILLNKVVARLIRRSFEKAGALESYYESRMMASFMNAHPGANIELQNYRVSPSRQTSYRSYDHHLTHAAMACFSSGFDEAACAIVDGLGENGGTSFYRYQGNRIERVVGHSKSMASLGWFYAQLCTWCRFQPLKGEEWKVMGLAPYGSLDDKMARILRKLISVKDGNLELGKNNAEAIRDIASLVRDVDSSPMDSANLAHTGQHVFSELFARLLSHRRLGFSHNLVLGGGCALNSVFVGSVTERTPFRQCFVSSAPADDGNAVGAAWLACYEDNPRLAPRRIVQSPYLGSFVSPRSMEHARRFSALPTRQIDCDDELCDEVAFCLSQGKIVAWMQGRAEFGPRALGNRSILADPRSATVKNRLNDQVKFREEFRPFAPSILHEYGPEYFECYTETPYMERALRFKKGVASRVPGVVHVDGTGRLQSVKQEWNPKYYRLIQAFFKRTGIPILLNTSFNVMGKPIVHSVEDALAVFLTSGIDLLVIENVLFYKHQELFAWRSSVTDSEVPSDLMS